MRDVIENQRGKASWLYTLAKSCEKGFLLWRERHAALRFEAKVAVEK